MTKKTPLKPCPCGETPKKLWLGPTQTSKYATACGDCCYAGLVEFRTRYPPLDHPKIYELAAEEWNYSPRAGDEA